MADNTERFSRGMKKLYEIYFDLQTGGKRDISDFLFNTKDEDLSANFALDELIYEPYAIAFRKPGEQSQTIPYNPGVGNVYEVPHTSAKTPIDERLRDAVIAGNEAVASYASNNSRLLQQILKQHGVNHKVTRNKLALDTIRTGIYSPKGLQGEDIGLEIDQGRDASLSIAYNFTAAGATMAKAVKAMYEAGRAKNMSMGNLVIIMGRKWQNQFGSDTGVLAFLDANSSNTLLIQNLNIENVENVYGLYKLAVYKPAATIAPMIISAYEPDKDFLQYKTATAEEFVPEEEAIMFSMNSTRYSVNRGVDVLNDAKQAVRAVGDVVYDSFTSEDPVTEYLRSQGRYAFIQADINTVVRSRGTFAAGSE